MRAEPPFTACRHLSGGAISRQALLPRLLLQERNHVHSFLRIFDEEIHLRAGNHDLRIGKPSLQCLLTPNDVRALNSIGVIKSAHRSRCAPVNAREMRPLAIVIESVATGAALFKDLLAAHRVAGSLCGGYGSRSDLTKQERCRDRCIERDCQPHFLRTASHAESANVASTTARCPRRPMYCTSVIPRTLLSFSAGTTIGPGCAAMPGAGWGNAVDIAV